MVKALQQTRVECTWDQGDEERERKLTQYHRWHEMEDDDLGAYLASSSSESEEEEQEQVEAKASKDQKRKKLRAMLLGGLVGGRFAASASSSMPTALGSRVGSGSEGV